MNLFPEHASGNADISQGLCANKTGDLKLFENIHSVFYLGIPLHLLFALDVNTDAPEFALPELTWAFLYLNLANVILLV